MLAEGARMYKKAAMAAVVLIPLLTIGTGVLVAARRSSSKTAAPAKTDPSKIATWLSESQAKPPQHPFRSRQSRRISY